MSVQTDIKNISEEVVSTLRSDTDLRKNAKVSFEQLGLPHNKTEEYRFAPITRALEKNFSFTSKPSESSIKDIKQFEIEDLASQRIVFINGQYSSKLSNIEGTNLVIESLNEEKHKKHFAQIADFKSDSLVSWNTSSWSDGIYIEVAANQIIDEPIIIHHIHDSSLGEVKTIGRNLIVIGKSSEATIIEKFDSVGLAPGFSNLVNEFVVYENAGLNFYSIQADNGNRFQFGQTSIWQTNNSRVNTYTFTLDGKFVRNNLHLTLDGEGCESHMYGLYLVQDDTLVDNHTVADHKKPNSFSNELYKGILEGNSKGVFNGKIFVRPNAQKTNAFQSNRNILLSDKSTINTKPQLEIWADDVKCSHGCTTGQLDEEALFYLRSRGIDFDTARGMILYAFAAEVMQTIGNEKLRAFIDNLISQRLHKNF